MPTPDDHPATPDHLTLALAGGATGPAHLRPLLETVLAALADGAATRDGPLPAGGPQGVNRRLRDAVRPGLPATGTGAEEALRTLVTAITEGSADPAEPHCVAHLHCPPLALAVAADLAATALNPSMDSWDQAPAATTLETDTTAALAALVYPDLPQPDATVTTGGTESNQLALLLARERARAAGAPGVQVVCGQATHHSVPRAAWLLGLPEPIVLPTPAGTLDPIDVHTALGDCAAPPSSSPPPAPPRPAPSTRCPTSPKPPPPTTPNSTSTPPTADPLLFSDQRRHLLARHSSSPHRHHRPAQTRLATRRRRTPRRPRHHRPAPPGPPGRLPQRRRRHRRRPARPPRPLPAHHPPPRHPQDRRHPARARPRRTRPPHRPRLRPGPTTSPTSSTNTPASTLHARPAISTVLFRPTRADDGPSPHIRRTLSPTAPPSSAASRADDRLWLKATLLNPDTPAAALAHPPRPRHPRHPGRTRRPMTTTPTPVTDPQHPLDLSASASAPSTSASPPSPTPSRGLAPPSTNNAPPSTGTPASSSTAPPSKSPSSPTSSPSSTPPAPGPSSTTSSTANGSSPSTSPNASTSHAPNTTPTAAGSADHLTHLPLRPPVDAVRWNHRTRPLRSRLHPTRPARRSRSTRPHPHPQPRRRHRHRPPRPRTAPPPRRRPHRPRTPLRRLPRTTATNSSPPTTSPSSAPASPAPRSSSTSCAPAPPAREELTWLARTEAIAPMEYCKLGLEHFTPDYTRYFHHLPEAVRDQLLPQPMATPQSHRPRHHRRHPRRALPPHPHPPPRPPPLARHHHHPRRRRTHRRTHGHRPDRTPPRTPPPEHPQPPHHRRRRPRHRLPRTPPRPPPRPPRPLPAPRRRRPPPRRPPPPPRHSTPWSPAASTYRTPTTTPTASAPPTSDSAPGAPPSSSTPSLDTGRLPPPTPHRLHHLRPHPHPRPPPPAARRTSPGPTRPPRGDPAK